VSLNGLASERSQVLPGKRACLGVRGLIKKQVAVKGVSYIKIIEIV
jgi:hypothetical protein